MSLAGMNQADHSVAVRGVEFLKDSVRPDGSWPIDTNLATWVTTLSVNALLPESLPTSRQAESIVVLVASTAIPSCASLHQCRPWRLGLDRSFRGCARRRRYSGCDPGTAEVGIAKSRGARRTGSGRQLVARLAEQRWGVADILSRLGRSAIRSQCPGSDGACSAGTSRLADAAGDSCEHRQVFQPILRFMPRIDRSRANEDSITWNELSETTVPGFRSGLAISLSKMTKIPFMESPRLAGVSRLGSLDRSGRSSGRCRF